MTTALFVGWDNNYSSITATTLGTYNLVNGTLTATSSENIAFGGFPNTGVFNQTGGSNTTPVLYLGDIATFQVANPNVLGTYNLSNGTLSVSGQELVGYWGTGIFNQSGGSNAASSLYLGYKAFVAGAKITTLGTYNLSNGATLSVSGGEYVGYAGIGAFNQTGGSNTTASLTIAYSNTASGTYALSGGVLTSNSTINNGQFTQSGGTANLGVITGTGTMTLGGSAELTSVNSFQQNTITINSGGYLAVASNATQVTNTATSLTITGSGQLDLANNSLITSASPSLVRQYLMAGYNGGSWNGTGGIMSSSAAAINMATNNLMALGYSSGTTIAALGLSPNQTLVKYVLAGDANLDGKVDISDLKIVLSNYLSGNPGTWDTGDFKYTGQTDINDLNLVLSNYLTPASTTVRTGAKASAASTVGTLTSTASPAVTPPVPAAGQLELTVNTVTGDVELYGNNCTIASLQTTSAGSLISSNWHNLHSDGYTNWQNTKRPDPTQLSEYDAAFSGSGDYSAVTGMIDYGDVFNINDPQDLVFQYGQVQSNDITVLTITGSVYYTAGVPEPTSLSLLGLAAAGLMGRRRRRP